MTPSFQICLAELIAAVPGQQIAIVTAFSMDLWGAVFPLFLALRYLSCFMASKPSPQMGLHSDLTENASMTEMLNVHLRLKRRSQCSTKAFKARFYLTIGRAAILTCKLNEKGFKKLLPCSELVCPQTFCRPDSSCCHHHRPPMDVYAHPQLQSIEGSVREHLRSEVDPKIAEHSKDAILSAWLHTECCTLNAGRRCCRNTSVEN